MKIEVYPGKNGKWYFRIKSRNGNILASSQGYSEPRWAVKGAESVLKGVAKGNVRIAKVEATDKGRAFSKGKGKG